MVAHEPSSEASEALAQFHQTLLPSTLANACLAPFYRELYSGIELPALEELSRLPLITKEQIRAAGHLAQLRERTVCDEVFTSGTTGVPFISLKGHAEQSYILKFYQSVFAEARTGPILRALQINNPYHGHLLSIPVPIHSHKIGIYDEGSFAHGRSVLLQHHRDPGVHQQVTLLIGLERCLRAFTIEARKAMPDGLKTGLTSVISYSQFLTTKWRKVHQEYWGCPVIDRFGLSEIFGGATEDPASGWWHFDPVCIPEVVGRRSRQTITEGIGELVLTALYPFQQVQPLVRYLTGDLVEVTHTRSARPGTLAFRPLGRARYGVPYSEGDGFLLAPSELLEAIDDVDGVERFPRFRDSSQVSEPYEVGHPRYATNFKVEGGKVIVTVSVQTQAKNSVRMKTAIHDRLCKLSPRFNQAIASGSAELFVETAGSLAPDLISHAE